MPSRSTTRRLPRSVSLPRGARLGTGLATFAAGAGLVAAAAPAAAAAPVEPNTFLYQGSTGPAVKEVQRALHIRSTGHFDAKTKRKVIAFQHRDALLIDGIVGPQTWDALFHITPPAQPAVATASPSSTAAVSHAWTAPTTTASSTYGTAASSTYATPTAASSYATPTAASSYATPTASSSYQRPAVSETSSTSSTGGYSIPSSIVQCESGGNYSAVNPSSGAGGAYQILPSTWQAYGGQGLPENASKAEQDRIAGAIYASQGGSAWVCR